MRDFCKSVMAGICIAIGAGVYLKTGGVVGAVGFSIGLVMVFVLNLNLYTGKVGYTLEGKKEAILTLVSLLGNAVGCCIMLAFPSETARDMMSVKLQSAWWLVLIKAFICGMIIYSAVQNKNNVLSTILHVAAFIVFGAEHCIADLCYIFAGGCYSLEVLAFFLLAAVGNALGSIVLRLITREPKAAE